MALKGFTIGEMRSIVVFLANVPTTSATSDREAVTTGGQNDQYTTLLNTRGRLRKSSGYKDLLLGEISGKDSYELICRFDTSLEAGLRANGKVNVDSVSYTIQTWEMIDQIKHIYKFKLNTQVVA